MVELEYTPGLSPCAYWIESSSLSACTSQLNTPMSELQAYHVKRIIKTIKSVVCKDGMNVWSQKSRSILKVKTQVEDRACLTNTSLL